MMNQLDPKAFHIAEALVNKYTGTMFLEGQVADEAMLEQINKELKVELIKRELREDMVEIDLDRGYGVAPSKFSIKFGSAKSNNRGNQQVTFYDEWRKG